MNELRHRFQGQSRGHRYVGHGRRAEIEMLKRESRKQQEEPIDGQMRLEEL